MLESCIANHPHTTQHAQLIAHAMVKGSGMLDADRVCKTVFKAASGLAKSATQNTTPALPIQSEAVG